MSQPAVLPTPETRRNEVVPPPPGTDVEGGAPKKASWVNRKVVVLILRSTALLFSALSFILMVPVDNFTSFSALCYVFTIVLAVTIYTAVFVGIHGHEVRTGEVVIPPNVAAWMNFVGDQIMALMLLSAASAGGEAVTALGQEYIGSGVDLATGSVAMAFLAFLGLEPAALISTCNFALYITKS